MKELEEKLQKLQPHDDETERKENEGQTYDTACKQAGRSVDFPTHLDPLSQLGVHKKYYNWDVVSTYESESRQQTYGTSSSFYFINQMSMYMEAALKEKQSFSRISHSDASEQCTPDKGIRNTSGGNIYSRSNITGCDLSRSTEETYLATFWDSSNVSIPIVDRDEFDMHYISLWESPRALRYPSALTDIILALCIQHEAQVFVTNPDRHSSDGSKNINPDTAGMWWHRRGQQLLADDSEEPSITTFQCHLLSAIWLVNAGLHNTAHSVMAVAMRVGVILGLHLEPPEDLPLARREFKKFLWWIAYALEMRFAMELGRPLAVSCGQVTCSLPSENTVISESYAGAALFPVHLVKLLLASRAVYITFYRQCAEELGTSGKTSIYEDPVVLENCAKFLSSKIDYLRTWVQHVPNALRLERKPGEPLSTDDLQLHFDASMDVSKAREMVHLEIYYHAMAISLFRPFITFSKKKGPATPTTDAHAVSCLKHAIAITSVMHQTCTKTSLLQGSLEVWQLQWSAALSLVGYILAYPNSPSTSKARKSLDTAIVLLRLRSRHAAAEVILELVAKADLLISRVHNSSGIEDSAPSVERDNMKIIDVPGSTELGWDLGFGFDAMSGSGSLSFGGFPTGSLSTLGCFDVSDQSLLDFLDFD